jgi:peptidoglycan hydrolase-like protein with peptidoglycan-binding domain
MDAEVRSGQRGRRTRRSAVAVALVVLTLAGCAGSGGKDETTSGPGTTDPSAVDSGAATTTTEAATTTTGSTTTTSTSTTTTSTTTTTTIPVTAIEEPPGALQSGSKGKRTLALQQALKDQHYDPGEPDGRFGLKTTQSVWAFQALHGLPKDGVVGPELEAQILSRPAQGMLRPNLGPTHTEIDLTRQVLIVWRDGAPTLITHVSSGSQVPYCEETDQGRNCGNAVTPLGVYTFYRQVQGIRDAPLGKLYDPVYFTGGFAVHGSPSVPNHPASHGCVRIPMAISNYFQSLVNLGETVEVFRS